MSCEFVRSLMSKRDRRKALAVYALLTIVVVLAMGSPVTGASNVPAMVTSTQTTITSTATGPLAIMGVQSNIAINKFGDLFVPSFNSHVVIEFPANGATPFAIFIAGGSYTWQQFGGVAVDANQNLYITAMWNDGSIKDSTIYKVPFVNGAYPAPYTFTGTVPKCTASSTSVCAWGNFYGAETGYWYDGYDVAFDGNGTGYMVTSQDGHGPKGTTIYACNTACAAGTIGTNDAVVLVDKLPHAVTSMAGDFDGDLFFSDGTASVYEIAAGTSTPVAIGSSFTSTLGVAVDAAGNLFVTDPSGVFEIPRIAGSYNAASQFQISAVNAGDWSGVGGAVDAHGNFYLNWGSDIVTKIGVNSGVFASTGVGVAGTPVTFNVGFNRSVTGVTVTSSGPEQGEFAISGSTCSSGGVAGGSCTFTGTFTPSGVGVRKGGIIVSDEAGDQSTVLVSGIGQGPGLTIDPGTFTQIGNAYSSAAGIAVDAAGNIFVADTGANAVYEYAGGRGPAISVGIGLVAPTGVAVDGAGNVYIADAAGSGAATGRVVEVPMISGALSSSAQTVVATGLGSPQGIFADGTGTLYIADSGNKNVLAVPPGEFGEAAAGLTFGSGLTSPSDVAVDNSGNLYITDAGTNQVVKISTEGLQSYVGTGFSFPSGVTVEPGGSIIVADQGNGRIVRIPNEAATLNVADQKVLKSSIASPHSVRMDSAGNLVVADNFANVLDSLNRTAAAISFGNVKDGTSSPAQTITLASTGNIDLGFGSPLFTPLTGDFSLAAGTNPCADGSTLSMGAVCELEATFSPTVGNAENQTVTFAAMGMNAAAFSVTMTGTGSQTSTPTLNVTMDLPSITTTQVLEVTVGASGGSGNPTVTGTITLTSGSYSSGAIALANGSATIDIPAGSLAIGNDTLTIGYAPDSASSLTYNSASKTTPVAVNPAGITTPIMTLTLPSATYNTLQMLTATVSVSGGVGNLVPTGTVTLTSGSYSSAAVSLSKGSANINVNAHLLALGSDLVTVSYTPDSASSSTYSSASKSASVNVTPVPAFKLSNAGLIIVAPGANTGNSSLITVTPTYGFTGKINLSCAASGAVICILVKGGSTINSLNISGATPVTAMLLVQTYAGTAKTILPLKDIFLGGGGVSLAGLLFLGFRFRRRDWGVLLGVAILILVCGVAVGCGTNALGKDPGTALGSYTVTVTGTDADTGKVTSSTDVSVTVD